MASTDALDSAQEATTSTTFTEAAADTAEPDEKTAPPANDIVPLFDIIDNCLEQLPALREFMPPRHSKACLLSDRGLETYVNSSRLSTDLLSDLDDLNCMEHAVLIIEEMDAVWFHALATRYPESLDLMFLAQHIVRLGAFKDTYERHSVP